MQTDLRANILRRVGRHRNQSHVGLKSDECRQLLDELRLVEVARSPDRVKLIDNKAENVVRRAHRVVAAAEATVVVPDAREYNAIAANAFVLAIANATSVVHFAALEFPITTGAAGIIPGTNAAFVVNKTAVWPPVAPHALAIVTSALATLIVPRETVRYRIAAHASAIGPAANAAGVVPQA
jgi:hypothetical protein